MQNLAAIDPAKQSRELSNALHRINCVVHSTLDKDVIIQHLVDEAAATMGCDSAAVSLREGSSWTVTHAHGSVRELIGRVMDDAQELHAALAVASREPVVVNDAFNDERFNREHLRAHNIKSVLVAPLISQDHAFGVVFFNYHSGVHRFSESEITFATQLAATTSIALENAKLFEELSRAAEVRTELASRNEQQARVFDTVLSAITDFAYIFDLDGRFIYANKALTDLWGLTLDDAVGKNFYDLKYPDELASTLQAHIQQVIDTGVGLSGETMYTSPTGAGGFYEYIFSPVFGANGAVEIVAGSTRDITDRKEMERTIVEQSDALAEQSRRKDEFIAMLSHELRNPLAPIRSAVQLLQAQDQALDLPEQRRILDIVERQALTLTKLIDDLLEVSRVLSGRIRLDVQPIDLRRTVDNALQTVSPLFEQKGHTVSLASCPAGLWVEADATRMEEVLVNLFNNAAKYTPDGGRIEVFCEYVGSYAQIRVRDNGIGIEKELLPQIFELFTQADRSLARSEGGLGIGLSLAHRLTHLHGGTLIAESPPTGQECGSEFSVRLALIESPTRNPNIEAKLVEEPALAARVLVIDDNVDLANVVMIQLQRLGAEVRIVHNGFDGVSVAKDWMPEIILLDLGLPGLDGFEVARSVRETEAAHTRLFAMTGYGSPTDIEMAREAGFDGHLTKPFGFEELKRILTTQ